MIMVLCAELPPGKKSTLNKFQFQFQKSTYRFLYSQRANNCPRFGVECVDKGKKYEYIRPEIVQFLVILQVRNKATEKIKSSEMPSLELRRKGLLRET